MTDQTDVYALAQEIRRVDGNHKLGAAELAEALMPFIRTRLIAELGQEVGAVAQVLEIKKAEGEDAWFGRVEFTEPLKVGDLLYSSPAHTSEARDAERYQWLVERGFVFRGCESVVDGYIQGEWLYRNHGADTAIDAAMRQEGE